MAITDKEKGVWGIDKVFDKQNQGSIWEYSPLRELWAVGRNTLGALGQNENEDSVTCYSSPVQIPGSTWVTGCNLGNYTIASLKSDGTLWAWGDNGDGQLAQNNRTQRSSPVQIPGTNWANISGSTGGESGVLATKTDGTLWVWGRNQYGQLGLSDTNQRSSPVQLPGTTWSTDATSFSTNAYMSMAIKTDGTLWTWGTSGNGRLGLSSQQSFSSPKQVPGTTWAKVGAISDGFQAIKTDGTLWTSGSNPFGELGIGSRTPYSSPKQVPGTTWKNIQGTGSGAMAVKTDGTLWSWGRNGQGQLGHNDSHSPGPESKTAPQQVGSDTNWESIAGGGGIQFGRKTDGTLWGWGNNDEGSLNNNNRTKRSSPTQIPGTIWKSLERVNRYTESPPLFKEQ